MSDILSEEDELKDQRENKTYWTYTFKSGKRVKVDNDVYVVHLNLPHNRKCFGLIRDKDHVQIDGWIINPNHKPRKWYKSYPTTDSRTDEKNQIRIWEPSFKNLARMERAYNKVRTVRKNKLDKFQSELTSAAGNITEFYGWADVSEFHWPSDAKKERESNRIFQKFTLHNGHWKHEDVPKEVTIDNLPAEMIQPKLALLYERRYQYNFRSFVRMQAITNLFMLAVDEKFADDSFRVLHPWERTGYTYVLNFANNTRMYIFRSSTTQYQTNNHFFEMVLQPNNYKELSF